jgi:hypothetical protein
MFGAAGLEWEMDEKLGFEKHGISNTEFRSGALRLAKQEQKPVVVHPVFRCSVLDIRCSMFSSRKSLNFA